jgi:signal transduction histidine kinase
VIRDESGAPTRIVGSCWDVTEWQEAKENLENARSLLEATIESTADGLLVVDLNGKVTAYNQRFLSCWQIPAELAEERDDAKLLGFVLNQLEEPEGFIQGVRRLYDNPDEESFDIIRLRNDRVLERRSIPQRVGGVSIGRVWSFHDVTERERLYRRALFLADATRLLASLDIEAALESLAHLSVPFIGEECAIDLLGNGAPRRLADVSRDCAQPIGPQLHGAVLAGHPILYNLEERSCMAAPLVVKDAVVGAITFIAPSDRHYTTQDLELAETIADRAALSVENAHLYKGAQEALRVRDEFLSIAAHEIRGPISSIHMAVQSLQKPGIPDVVRSKVLEIMDREDRRLTRFVDELLDLSKIRSGRLQFRFEQVDLADVVRDAASRLAPELAKTGSNLSIITEGRPIGRWDRFRLDQVATNLLSNAIKFGLGKPITVTVREKEGITTLLVKDQGVGIPQEMLEEIFKPFERASSVRHYGGLGLGLFIVRMIVQGLGGTVRAESRPNAGSTFTVELPRTRYA